MPPCYFMYRYRVGNRRMYCVGNRRIARQCTLTSSDISSNSALINAVPLMLVDIPRHSPAVTFPAAPTAAAFHCAGSSARHGRRGRSQSRAPAAIREGGCMGPTSRLSQMHPPCVVACIPVLHAYRYRSVASSYRFLLQCIWEPRC